MSARIRGHYRIDSLGRVEAITDVNAVALKRPVRPAAKAGQLDARVAKFAVYGLVTFCLCVGGMMALPRMERAFLSSQYARIAPLRHMHGQRLHDAADRLLAQNQN